MSNNTGNSAELGQPATASNPANHPALHPLGLPPSAQNMPPAPANLNLAAIAVMMALEEEEAMLQELSTCRHSKCNPRSLPRYIVNDVVQAELQAEEEAVRKKMRRPRTRCRPRH